MSQKPMEPIEITWYEKLSRLVETKAFRFTVFTAIAILVGGLVELPPIILMETPDKIPGLKPYNALELAGRDIYQQEGCFYCHTQLIRPFKWETDRWDRNREYGSVPFSRAGEYAYDHPFLWGSKRTGPDLAHEASLNNNAEWQREHLKNPRATSPDSIMPAYAWLFEEAVDVEQIQAHMRALQIIGVPYPDSEIAAAGDLVHGKTQGDALVAYLLKLGKDAKQ